MIPRIKRHKTAPSGSGRRISPLLSKRMLAEGIGLMGLLGVFSSGTAVAETPSASDLQTNPGIATPAAPDRSLQMAPVPDAAVTTRQDSGQDSADALERRLSSPGAIASPETMAPMQGSAAKPNLDSSESYIDSTSYSLGATQRSSEVAAQAKIPQAPRVAVPTEVSVGPLSVGSEGLSVIGQTTASARDYYNRTIRPPGRLIPGNIGIIFPLAIPAPITSLFGWRVHPITGSQTFHSGTDLGAPMGTPVLAAYAGQVAIADFLGGYGLAITLAHNKGTQETLYGHLSEIFVKPGEWVKQGTVIGRVGSTGLSTGPHLHFEFRQMTSEGWVAMDAGAQLEYALAQFVRAIQTGQAVPQDTNFIGSLNGGVTGTLKVAQLNPGAIGAKPKQPNQVSAPVSNQNLPIVIIKKTN